VGTVQEVRIAKRTGFCYGVREAIDKAKEASAAGKPTHTLGQVVHNEGVVQNLQNLGIETVDTLDDVDHGAAVVIRAHGVRPDVMQRAEERGLEVIDGTCTWVIQEQKELVKLVDDGYTIVILGTPKHPEVVGPGGRPARVALQHHLFVGHHRHAQGHRAAAFDALGPGAAR
jgi:4-hydroxy-3-methylbut-2-enyl diphosphate reductase